MKEDTDIEKTSAPEGTEKKTGSDAGMIETDDKQAEAEAYLRDITRRRQKKTQNGKDLFWKAIIFGLLGGLMVAMLYLFILRDNDSREEYLQYFAGMATSIETFKANSVAIVARSGELIKKGINNEAGETYFKEKEEFLGVLDGNISACEYAKKEIDKITAPYEARATRKEIINFFDEAEKCMMELKNAVRENSEEKLTTVTARLEELKKVKISGYVYVD